MLVARDRLGIKPVYLHNDGRRLVFASEAKALLALPSMTTELDDPTGLVQWATADRAVVTFADLATVDAHAAAVAALVSRWVRT